MEPTARNVLHELTSASAGGNGMPSDEARAPSGVMIDPAKTADMKSRFDIKSGLAANTPTVPLAGIYRAGSTPPRRPENPLVAAGIVGISGHISPTSLARSSRYPNG